MIATTKMLHLVQNNLLQLWLRKTLQQIWREQDSRPEESNNTRPVHELGRAELHSLSAELQEGRNGPIHLDRLRASGQHTQPRGAQPKLYTSEQRQHKPQAQQRETPVIGQMQRAVVARTRAGHNH
jgi:hypothetical protein